MADSSPSTEASWQELLSASRVAVGTLRGDPGGADRLAQAHEALPRQVVRESDDVSVSLVYVSVGPGVDVCGGKIGQNHSKFCTVECTEDATTCNYVSHAAKANIQKFPAYYIRYPKGTTAYCEPCLELEESGLSDVIRAALNGQRSASEWARVFPSIAAAALLDNEVQQADLIARGERELVVGPTPSFKRRVLIFEQDGTDRDNAIDMYSATSSPIVDDGLFMRAQEGDRDDRIDFMLNHWNEMVEQQKMQTVGMKHFEREVHTYLEEVDDKVVVVSALMGQKPVPSSLPLTVWSSLQTINHQVEMVANDVVEAVEGTEELFPKMEEIRKDQSLAEAKMEVLKDEMVDMYNKVTAEIAPSIAALRSSVEGVAAGTSVAGTEAWRIGQAKTEQELDNIKQVLAHVARQRGGSGDTSAGGGSIELVSARVLREDLSDMTVMVEQLVLDNKRMAEKVKLMEDNRAAEMRDVQRLLLRDFNAYQNERDAELAQMRDEMSALRATVEALRRDGTETRRTVPSLTPGLRTATGVDMSAEMVEMQVTIAELADQVHVLQVDTLAIKSEINTTAVVFGGETFLKEEDYHEFVMTNFSNGDYGYCIDFISLLEIGVAQDRVTKDGLLSRKLTLGAGFTRDYEAIVFTSFGTIFPALFGTDQDTTDPFKKMGDMKTYMEWDTRIQKAGRRHRIHDKLVNLKRALDIMVATNCKRIPRGAALFKELIANTWTFWESLTSWIHSFEEEMTSLSVSENTAAHKAQIWSLICWMLHSMFKEMAIRRAAGQVVANSDLSDRIETGAIILQGTLGCHKFMQELMDAQFIRHPIFSSTITEYLVTSKASAIALEELKLIIKRLDAQIRGQQADKDRKAAAAAAAGKRQTAGE
jgi:hypothetical protein